MKVYFTLDNIRVSSYSEFPMDVPDTDVQYSVETDIDFEKLHFCDYKDGKLMYNEAYAQEAEKEKERNHIRTKRERECFPYINRGALWYERNVNTDERKAEFDVWYTAWLQATDTGVIPDKPEWLY